jgi:transposase
MVGRPSIPPERLLRALLLQVFYSVRSERMLMEQLDYNLLFRGLLAWRWTSECGITRCSARIGIGY